MRLAGSLLQRGTATLLIWAMFSGAPLGWARAEELEPTSSRRSATRQRSHHDSQETKETAEAASNPADGESSVYSLRRSPDRPRSVFWMPLVSFLLPGFDQWWEGQYLSAAAYSGVAMGGLVYAQSVAAADNLVTDSKKRKENAANEQSESQEKEATDTSLDSKDVALRKYTLGTLVYQGAGGMSAYHAFRTAVRSRKALGQYEFLKYEETPLDVLTAPFHFEYLSRPTTFIPLGIGAALAYLMAVSEPPKDLEKSRLSSADWFFTGAYSYNAGTHEEAMFRGWLMPFLTQQGMSPIWANVSQSALFALAHLGTNSFPLPQLLLGYHLGYVRQKTGWRLGEAVFIHVWWDVLAFASAFSYSKKQTEAAARLLPPPVLWLPPLTWQL